MKRKHLDKPAKITNIAMSVLMFLTGVFVAVLPEIGNIALRWLIGVNLIIIGGGKLLGYFSDDMYRLAFQFDFAFGIFCAVFGILIIISPTKMENFIPVAAGIFAAIDGLIKLQISVDARKFGLKQWPWLLISALLLTCAAIADIIVTYNTKVIFIRASGILFACDAIVNCFFTSYTVHIRQNKKNKRYTE